MDNEIFKTVKINDEDTKYELSNYGNCRNRFTKKSKKSSIDKSTGRVNLKLTHNGYRYSKSLARWMALTFLDTPDGDISEYDADHINGDPSLNVISNIQWLRKSDNIYKEMYIENKIFRGENNGNSKITEDLVIKILNDYTNGLSCSKIAEKYNINENIPRSIVSGRNWRHVSNKFDCVKLYKKGSTPVKYTNEFKNKIKTIIQNDPDIKNKDIYKLLQLDRTEKLDNLFKRIRKIVKLEGSTTIENDDMYNIYINL